MVKCLDQAVHRQITFIVGGFMHASHSRKDIPDRIKSGFQCVVQGHDVQVEGNELEQGTKVLLKGRSLQLHQYGLSIYRDCYQ